MRDEVNFLVDFLEDRKHEIVDFAGELIGVPSPNPPGDERQVAELLTGRFQRFGLEAEVVARDPARPNVLLKLPGRSGGRRLLLNGHIDTKPPGDVEGWRTDPYTPKIIEGNLHGLGACDMKGQVAALTYAAMALANISRSFDGELILALSADEECGSRYGARYLVEECDLTADAAIVAEPSSIQHDWEHIALLSRGFCGFRVGVHGTQGHSSLSDLVPTVNASTKMAYVLWRLDKELKLDFPPHPLCPEGVTVNPGVLVQGGVNYGVCPGYAEFAVDVRTLPGMTQKRLRRNVEDFLDRLRWEDDSLRVEMMFEDGPLGWNEGTEIAADAPIVQAALQASEEVLGHQPSPKAFPGGSDAASFSGRVGIPTIPAFGPGMLPLAHSPNEYISTESIIQAAKIYALTAMFYLSDDT